MYQIVLSKPLKASAPSMTIESACRRLVDEFRSRPLLRAGSLITTVFGDAIAPRGGKVWLGSLIKVMSNFGIGDRLVRTSVYRLAHDGWLQSEQIGRRSYYSLTATGRERFDQATHRIYGAPSRSWDGNWCLLLLSGLETTAKEGVRKECAWLGFGALSANILAHPAPDLADLDVTIQRLDAGDSLVVLSGQTLRNETGMRRLAHDCWNLATLDEKYANFVKQFRPLLNAVNRNGQGDDKTAFVARTLLIQEYRKILLRDPLLPNELLPARWHGTAAYQLCRDLYQSIYQGADRYLGACMETAVGPLPAPGLVFWKRFGGLDRQQKRKATIG
jgi:phenylacetic acid degradation operon negative regulatory protein